tara:strand:+ start:656 stop:1066 length:411 start_codon:yes stop_codon:yes gene_type:complete
VSGEDNFFNISRPRPRPRPYMRVGLGRTHFNIVAVATFMDSLTEYFQSHELRSEIQLTGNYARDNFDRLEEERQGIDEEMGEDLSWYNPPNVNRCRIYIRHTIDLYDTDNWLEYHRSLSEKLNKMHQIFSARIATL